MSGQVVRGYDTALLKPGGIEDFDLMTDDARRCAKRLARYITDPSTIRAYVVNAFGTHAAPSREEIAALVRQEQEPPPEASSIFARTYGAPQPGDERHYAPVALVVPESPAPEPVVTGDPRTAPEVLAAVARAYGLAVDDITGPARRQAVVEARKVAVALLVARGSNVSAAGRRVRRHHTSALSMIESLFARDLARSPTARAVWEGLRPPDVAHCASSDQLRAAVAARRTRHELH